MTSGDSRYTEKSLPLIKGTKRVQTGKLGWRQKLGDVGLQGYS